MKISKFTTAIGFLSFLQNKANSHFDSNKRVWKEFREQNMFGSLTTVLRQLQWKNVLLITNKKDIKGLTCRFSSDMVQSSLQLLPVSNTSSFNFLPCDQNCPHRFIVWCDLRSMENVFMTAKKNIPLIRKVAWLLVLEQVQPEINLLQLQNFKHILQEDSNVFILVLFRTKQEAGYKLSRLIYQRVLSECIHHQVIATHTASYGLNYLHTVSKQQRLKDYELIIAVIHYPPAMMVEERRGHLQVTGYFADVIGALSNRLGFRYKFIRPAFNSFGIISDNGSSDSVLGLLHSRRADIGTFGLDLNRLPVVDYAGHMLTTYTATAYRNPKITPKVEFTSYLKPFSSSVWTLIIISWLVSCVLQCPSVNNYHHSRRFWEQKPWRKKPTKLSKVALCIFHLVENIIAVGFRPLMEVLHCRFSTRIVMLTFWGFVLLIQHSYTGVLISTNTVVKKEWRFEDIADLVQYGYKAGVLRSGYFEKEIKDDKREKFRKAWRKIQSDSANLIASTLIGVQRVCQEHFAYSDSALALFAFEGQICHYEVVKSKRGLHSSIAVPEASPYKDILSVGMLELKSAGILYRLERKHGLNDESGNRLSKGKTNKPTFKFMEASAAFILLAFGYVVAATLLAIETWVYKLFLIKPKYT